MWRESRDYVVLSLRLKQRGVVEKTRTLFDDGIEKGKDNLLSTPTTNSSESSRNKRPSTIVVRGNPRQIKAWEHQSPTVRGGQERRGGKPEHASELKDSEAENCLDSSSTVERLDEISSFTAMRAMNVHWDSQNVIQVVINNTGRLMNIITGD